MTIAKSADSRAVTASVVATVGAAHIVAGSVVLLPLDITLLVKSSLELHRGSTSKAVEDIRGF